MIAPFVMAASVVLLAAPQDIQRSIDGFVSKAPGAVVAVGIIDRGKMHTYFSGTPQQGAPKLDEFTEFQIGSITKTFTSTILAEMSLQGKVSLDDPIGKYLPPGMKPPTYHGEQITLLNLAEQNSGLPAMPANIKPSNMDDPYADYSQRDLYSFISGYELPRAPGDRFEYSNLGVGLLGTLLANAAHTSYENLLQTQVLAPLGMHDTTSTMTPAISKRMMPGFSITMHPQPLWTFTSLAAAGSINSNVHDMLIYLQANMNAPAGTLGKAMALAHEPRTPSLPSQRIGLNWIVAPSGVIWHNGAVGGYSSFLAFSPKDDVGLVVLTNVDSSDALLTDHLGAHLLEPRYAVAPMLPGPLKGLGDSPYSGVYALSPAFKITVYEQGGILYGQATGQQPILLTLQSGTTYSVEGVDASITFNRDAAGKVISLTLHQNGMDQIGKRE